MGLLDSIVIADGPAAYAEPFDAGSFLKMPANALVNVAYLLVAAGWLVWLARLPATDPRAAHRPRFLAFALVGAAYGPIQFWRIVTQDHLAAVVDQWITLPFFGLFCTWALDLLAGVSRARTVAILVASVASYGLALVSADGFVVALAVHLVAAIALGIALLSRSRRALWPPFVAALACCVAFVVFKEADFAIARLPPFHRLTGHFWSKLGDAGQLHFSLVLFARAHLARARA